MPFVNKKFEYKQQILKTKMSTQELNDFGKEGWHLVTFYQEHDGDFVYIFDREKVNADLLID